MSLKLLLCDFYKIDSITSFIMNFPEEYPELNKKQIKIIHKVLNGYPVQYALKKADFNNLEFYVNKHTLIPRPETEELVIYTIKKAQQVFDPKEKLDYVDLGCGSGNILISIEKNAGFAWNSVTGVDISFLTLQATRKNKKYLGSPFRGKRKARPYPPFQPRASGSNFGGQPRRYFGAYGLFKHARINCIPYEKATGRPVAF